MRNLVRQAYLEAGVPEESLEFVHSRWARWRDGRVKAVFTADIIPLWERIVARACEKARKAPKGGAG